MILISSRKWKLKETELLVKIITILGGTCQNTNQNRNPSVAHTAKRIPVPSSLGVFTKAADLTFSSDEVNTSSSSEPALEGIARLGNQLNDLFVDSSANVEQPQPGTSTGGVTGRSKASNKDKLSADTIRRCMEEQRQREIESAQNEAEELVKQAERAKAEIYLQVWLMV